ncbi:MAG TPA: hypothetical protein VK479_16255 [Micropepsaceae bacterium]|jgi:hypothetical protein|nr:hypothetical protein [Micropepsaceae bacterium]
MRMRVVTAALSVLLGTLWVSAVSAATSTAPTAKVAQASIASIANLNLGGVMAPLGQDMSSLRPNGASVARGLQLDLARGRNWDPYNDVFPASGSLNSSFLGGTNNFAGASFAIGRDVDLNVGHLALGLDALSDTQPSTLSRDLAARLGTNLRSIGTTSANLNWNFADWGAIGLTASRSSGNSSLLGGSLRSGGPAESSALGISARVGFAEGWVTTLTYAEGVTQLDLNREQLGVKSDPLRSQAYGIGLAKTGLFGDDAFGIALSRPLQIYTGSKSFGALNTNFALANTQARESDVELGYVTTFLDGTLALQANAAYQVNAAGTRGQNAVAGVARAKLNF